MDSILFLILLFLGLWVVFSKIMGRFVYSSFVSIYGGMLASLIMLSWVTDYGVDGEKLSSHNIAQASAAAEDEDLGIDFDSLEATGAGPSQDKLNHRDDDECMAGSTDVECMLKELQESREALLR